ncbi:unnamed protein product [Protopolystoma xenopodis]|uniref:Uncharacterized protein n=1 Tax=Protopolystoma xenopodis TaxID=117903 RepID=A0A3S5CBU5_9PLAT|nr:unnamed protein product [Protopolystoma xenopodis]
MYPPGRLRPVHPRFGHAVAARHNEAWRHLAVLILPSSDDRLSSSRDSDLDQMKTDSNAISDNRTGALETTLVWVASAKRIIQLAVYTKRGDSRHNDDVKVCYTSELRIGRSLATIYGPHAGEAEIFWPDLGSQVRPSAPKPTQDMKVKTDGYGGRAVSSVHEEHLADDRGARGNKNQTGWRRVQNMYRMEQIGKETKVIWDGDRMILDTKHVEDDFGGEKEVNNDGNPDIDVLDEDEEADIEDEIEKKPMEQDSVAEPLRLYRIKHAEKDGSRVPLQTQIEELSVDLMPKPVEEITGITVKRAKVVF